MDGSQVNPSTDNEVTRDYMRRSLNQAEFAQRLTKPILTESQFDQVAATGGYGTTGTRPQIRIDQQLNGYMVQVGCKTLVFESKERLISELARYLADRAGVEKEYLEKFK